MKAQLIVLLTCFCMISCQKEVNLPSCEIVVEFKCSIQEFEASPPAAFELLKPDEQAVLSAFLEGEVEFTHISIMKYLSDDELHFCIVNYTPYVRNGREWCDSATHIYKLKGGVWVLSSSSIT